jgi:antitoxin ParD1/3/4
LGVSAILHEQTDHAEAGKPFPFEALSSPHRTSASLCRKGSMKIALPDKLKAFVEEQVSQRVYGTSSEYECKLLTAGVAPKPTAPVDAAYFAELRVKVRNT